MRAYQSALDNNTGEFVLHADGCRDIDKTAKRIARANDLRPSEVFSPVRAVSTEEAIKQILSEDFGSAEPYGKDALSYPEGSWGYAGFTVQVLPCCKHAPEVE